MSNEISSFRQSRNELNVLVFNSLRNCRKDEISFDIVAKKGDIVAEAGNIVFSATMLPVSATMSPISATMLPFLATLSLVWTGLKLVISAYERS